MKDYNSNTNQEIKRKFVDREVICLFSYPMEAILAAGSDMVTDMANWEDIENYETYPEYNGSYAKFDGGSFGERQKEIQRLNNLVEECWASNDDQVINQEDEIREEIEALENLDPEPQEIYEWWIVTDDLFDKLKEKGEPVIEWQNLSIWGRTTTGQAILLDHVISEICSDMEILEGQKYSWAEKQTV